jgi:hypothetical protein
LSISASITRAASVTLEPVALAQQQSSRLLARHADSPNLSASTNARRATAEVVSRSATS